MAERWAWAMMEVPWTKPTHRLVMVTLGLMAGPTGLVSASIESLMAATGLGRSTVFRARSEASERGLLVARDSLPGSRLPVLQLLASGVPHRDPSELSGVPHRDPSISGVPHRDPYGSEIGVFGVPHRDPSNPSVGLSQSRRGVTRGTERASANKDASITGAETAHQTEMLGPPRVWLSRILTEVPAAYKNPPSPESIRALERDVRKWDAQRLAEGRPEIDLDAEAEDFIDWWNSKGFSKRTSWWRTWRGFAQRARGPEQVPARGRSGQRRPTPRALRPRPPADYAAE